MNEIVRIILYLGAVQGLLLSVFLFSIRTNKISNRLLACLTLSWGIVLLTFALKEKGLYEKVPHLILAIDQLLFLFFPLLYLQVKYLLASHTKFQSVDLFHFLPILISIIFNVDFFLMSGEDKINMIQNSTKYFNILETISNEVIAIQGVIYSFMAIRLIRSYQKKIKDFESTMDKSIIKVLYVGISLNLFSWIIGIVGLHLEYLNINVGFDYFAYTYLILVLVIYIISYAAVKSPEIFKLDASTIMNKSLKIINPLESDNQRSLHNQLVVDTKLLSINEQLIQFMVKEKPYLNPEINLPEMANSLNISRNLLSGVINQFHNENFYGFINHYRVEEVKKLIQDPANKHFKLISLAYDAGFNSKASFNRIFKQITNMTPSQFIMNKQNS